jgi:hypothetical protein
MQDTLRKKTSPKILQSHIQACTYKHCVHPSGLRRRRSQRDVGSSRGHCYHFGRARIRHQHPRRPLRPARRLLKAIFEVQFQRLLPRRSIHQPRVRRSRLGPELARQSVAGRGRRHLPNLGPLQNRRKGTRWMGAKIHGKNNFSFHFYLHLLWHFLLKNYFY